MGCPSSPLPTRMQGRDQRRIQRGEAATDYPMLSVEPTIDWGPGWVIVGDADRDDLDAALAVHELAMDGDTIASI